VGPGGNGCHGNQVWHDLDPGRPPGVGGRQDATLPGPEGCEVCGRNAPQRHGEGEQETVSGGHVSRKICKVISFCMSFTLADIFKYE